MSTGFRVCVCCAGIYEKAVDAITEMVKSVKPGDPTDPKTTMGPLINKKGIEKVP